MTLRLFIPGDAGALAVGADEVAAALQVAAIARGAPIEIVRTGSRGLYWLEPLVEVETPAGRVGYRACRWSHPMSRVSSPPACSTRR